MADTNERVAVLEKAMDGMEKGFSRVEQKLDSLLEHIEKKFVPRAEMDSHNRRLEGEIENLRVEMKSMRDKDWKILGFIVTAIATIGAATLTIIFK